jgi:hypothetical protein
MGRLLNSHIIPAAAYDRIADRDAAEPSERNPVRVTSDASILASAQLRAYILCPGCEERFGVWERYCLPLLVQPDGSFPWLERRRTLPIGSKWGDVAFSANVNVETLSLFAISLFWRLSVFREASSLGSDESACSDYLLRRSNFPERAALWVTLLDRVGASVSPPDRAAATFFSRQYPDYVLHRLVILGADLRLYVCEGPSSLAMRELCFARRGRVFVRSTDDFARDVMGLLRDSNPKGALARRRPPSRG